MLKHTRKGAHAEYLANYMLSLLGFTAPVPRQEDYGVDFFCSLNIDDNNRTLVGDAYAIQIKSTTDSLIYGKDSKNNWRRDQIDFLFNVKVPFFLGVVDLESETLSIYSLSTHRFIKKVHPNCSLITFEFDPSPGETKIHGITASSQVSNLLKDYGDHKNYKINLQHPVIQITSKSLNDPIRTNEYINTMRLHIRMEQKNIVFDELKWPHFHWPHRYITNHSDIEYKWIHFDGEPEISNPDIILNHNGQLINALALSFKLYNRKPEYEAMLTITKSLPDFHQLGELKSKHPEIYD